MTLQIPEQPQYSREDTVLGHLASRQMLLVLDNCEHLVATGTDIIRELLSTCPYLRILATSRRAWDIFDGERVYIVPPLTLPPVSLVKRPHTAPLPDISMYTAMGLFLERTLDIMPAFVLTAQNVQSVAQICRSLDGIPLAINLAAGWMQTLTPKQILARLVEGLDMLRDTRQSLPVRHRQLLTTLEASYQLLSPSLQTLFRRLSIFQGGWVLDAAESVCAMSQLVDNLRQLQERSLVEAEPDGEGIRFRLLETLRQYGRQLLEGTGEVVLLHHHHINYFVRVAESAELELVGPRQHIVLTQIEREYENMIGALEWAYETQDSERGLRLAGAIWRFWYVRGDFKDGLFWIECFLRLENKATPPVRSKALKAAGNLAYQHQEYTQSRAFFQARLELEQTQGSRSSVASTMGSLANVASALGDYKEARSLYEQSLIYFREMEDTRGIVMTLGNLAVVASKEGDHLQSCAYHQGSISFFRATGDIQNLAVALNNLADSRMALYDLPAAVTALSESLELSRTLESNPSLAHGLTLSFFLTAQHDNIEQAAIILGAHDAFRERIQSPLPPYTVEAYQLNRAEVLARLGKEAHDQAVAQGRLLTHDEAIAFALASITAFSSR